MKQHQSLFFGLIILYMGSLFHMYVAIEGTHEKECRGMYTHSWGGKPPPISCTPSIAAAFFFVVIIILHTYLYSFLRYNDPAQNTDNMMLLVFFLIPGLIALATLALDIMLLFPTFYCYLSGALLVSQQAHIRWKQTHKATPPLPV